MATQSGMVEGAKVGSAFGPWGAAIGGAAGLTSDLLKDGGGPLTSGQSSLDGRGWLDGSGWTVSTGKASATGGTVSRSGDPFGGSSLAPLTGITQAGGGWVLGLAMIGVAAVIFLKGRG